MQARKGKAWTCNGNISATSTHAKRRIGTALARLQGSAATVPMGGSSKSSTREDMPPEVVTVRRRDAGRNGEAALSPATGFALTWRRIAAGPSSSSSCHQISSATASRSHGCPPRRVEAQAQGTGGYDDTNLLHDGVQELVGGQRTLINGPRGGRRLCLWHIQGCNAACGTRALHQIHEVRGKARHRLGGRLRPLASGQALGLRRQELPLYTQQ